jgi:formiminotetrahydrofolate cyclodeaminase
MVSDLTVGAALARSAVEGALANVEINLKELNDAEFASAVRERVGRIARP